MYNIIIGVLFILGGLSGKYALKGTDSTIGLAVLGAGLVVWGIYQLGDENGTNARARGSKTKNKTRPASGATRAKTKVNPFRKND